MGCCGTELKIPSPYQFAFTGTGITEENKHIFESNAVKTSKYNLLTFVPSKNSMT